MPDIKGQECEGTFLSFFYYKFAWKQSCKRKKSSRGKMLCQKEHKFGKNCTLFELFHILDILEKIRFICYMFNDTGKILRFTIFYTIDPHLKEKKKKCLRKTPNLSMFK